LVARFGKIRVPTIDAISLNKPAKARASSVASADERLAFERLLVDLSAQFANLAGDRFEVAIQTARVAARDASRALWNEKASAHLRANGADGRIVCSCSAVGIAAR
jgi:hypothetical protein